MSESIDVAYINCRTREYKGFKFTSRNFDSYFRCMNCTAILVLSKKTKAYIMVGEHTCTGVLHHRTHLPIEMTESEEYSMAIKDKITKHGNMLIYGNYSYKCSSKTANIIYYRCVKNCGAIIKHMTDDDEYWIKGKHDCEIVKEIEECPTCHSINPNHWVPFKSVTASLCEIKSIYQKYIGEAQNIEIPNWLKTARNMYWFEHQFEIAREFPNLSFKEMNKLSNERFDNQGFDQICSLIQGWSTNNNPTSEIIVTDVKCNSNTPSYNQFHTMHRSAIANLYNTPNIVKRDITILPNPEFQPSNQQISVKKDINPYSNNEGHDNSSQNSIPLVPEMNIDIPFLNSLDSTYLLPPAPVLPGIDTLIYNNEPF